MNDYAAAGLQVARRGASLWLTLNRPERLNALSRALLRALDGALDEVGSDPDVRCVVLTGEGSKAFSAGADVKEWMEPKNYQAVREFCNLGQEVFRRIELCPKPVIAAINGVALGGGLELAMACDLRIAVEGARLGQPEVTLGAYPGWQGISRLVRHVGLSRAKELFLLGEPITAERAAEWGLVNQVVPADRLADAAGEMADVLARRGPLALAIGKEVAALTSEIPLAHAKLESLGVALIAMTDDFVEGAAAFREKRLAKFTGR
ncbi:hypothetical protein EPN29_11255 [bacterium]|nr:MAG: hypothetical protein EPN29_11255 [bacterium]